MSIAKPFTFVANTYAKASEVNANFDTVYSQVNSNISAIFQNAVDIENLENNKADINGSSAQRFAVADAITNSDAVNKQSLIASIGNSIDYISGFIITKDSGSPNDTIIVSEGSCYDSTNTVVLNKTNSSTKTNGNQSANATYYIYVIGNSTGSSVDILISTDMVTPALPTGYSLYRQIGYYNTDGSNNIQMILQYGNNTNTPKPQASLVETYTNGASWYRIWSDGWCEQGGETTVAGMPGTVTLLKEYRDTSYLISITPYQDTDNVSHNAGFTSAITTTSFGFRSERYIKWETKGYIEM